MVLARFLHACMCTCMLVTSGVGASPMLVMRKRKARRVGLESWIAMEGWKAGRGERQMRWEAGGVEGWRSHGRSGSVAVEG